MKITENYRENGRINLTVNLSLEEMDSYFVQCDSCGKIMLRNSEELLEYDDGYFCPDCTTTCYECGELLPISYSYTVEDSSVAYCEHCYSESTYICDGCGRHYRYDDDMHDLDGRWLCDDCYDDNSSVLDDYHNFKDYGDLRFLGNESRTDSPYMGFELEVDSNGYVDLRPVIDEIVSTMPSDYYHYERDGSLNYGFEMISQPCSLNYHLSLTDSHKQVFRTLLNSGLRGHDISRCGLHIHIDRAFFGDKEDSSIAKLLYLFEKFRDDFIKFSRRTPYQLSDWCRFRKYDNTSAGWIKNTVKDSKGYQEHSARYHAINLCNLETIEIRLWRSSLNIDTFVATLKFTDRLARLVKDTRATVLARMSFLDLIGDDEDVKRYWNRIKEKAGESEEE